MAIKNLELKNEFNLGDVVYHKITGEKAIVTCIRIVVDTTYVAVYEYDVALSMQDSTWISEIELTVEEVI